jgi:SAM-dependent methyltransferase
VPTYLCDLTNIPVETEKYDYVVLNQVLEHLPRPSSTLVELNRILKDGGRLLCSTPLFYQEHEIPWDYYRYTRLGLRLLFTDAGFHIEKIEWLEGYFGTIGYQMGVCYKSLPIRPSQLGGGIRGYGLSIVCLALRALSLIGAGVMYRLDRIQKIVECGMRKTMY